MAKNVECLVAFYAFSIEKLEKTGYMSDEDFISLLNRFVEWIKTPQSKEGLNLSLLEGGLGVICDVINKHIEWLRL